MASKLHVKKGDMGEVISGKDKGVKGKVLQSLPKDGKIIVEGVNKIKKHTKGTQKDPKGGIVEKEAPIASSNVLLYCPACKKGVRYGQKVEGDKKSRVCKKCGKEL